MPNTFAKYRPSSFDQAGVGVTDDNADWLVAPCGTSRDADALQRANWKAQQIELNKLDPEGADHESLSFGHWACGHFCIMIVRPDSSCAKAIVEMETDLADYPILDEELCSEFEQEEANEVWANCFNAQERIEYIRKNRSQFEFHNLADMLGCVRGKYFAGYASELIY